jgi:hypothetical protein
VTVNTSSDINKTVTVNTSSNINKNCDGQYFQRYQ